MKLKLGVIGQARKESGAAGLSSKKIVLAMVIVVAIFVLYSFAWPQIASRIATTHLQKVSSQELQPLLQPVGVIMQGAKPQKILECDEVAHTHTETQLYCQNAISYKYDPTPLPAASRARVLAQASVLDKALAQNGWTIDRPQDEAKTVAASVPSTPLQAFHGGGVPFHKNVGNISCNFELTFDGPTDGVSPGAININRFSCQQDISYFMLHITDYTNRGFGG